MSYDPLKRDSSWHMVLPGCYVDPAGHGHLFPDEFLAFLQVRHPEAGFDPNSKEDYDMVVNQMVRIWQQENPGAEFKIVRHEREKL